MLPSIRALMTLLIFQIIITGCLSQPIEEEIKCPPLFVLEHESVVESIGNRSVVANVRALNVFNDSTKSLVFTEPLSGAFSIIQLPCTFPCSETRYHSTNLTAPVRIDSADIDGDGILDLIVSDIGILFPSPEKVGKLTAIYSSDFTNDSVGTERIIIEEIGRTVCSEAADLDGDLDIDLTLCEFGDTNGSVGWLENIGGYNWTWHKLENKSGAIEAIPIDIDNDGDMDIVSVISQLSEEIVIYWNDGTGGFESEVLFKSEYPFYGMSGMNIVDIEGDGDMDILFTNGDMMDGDFPNDKLFWEYHGLSIIENRGQGEFEYERLLGFSGAYDSALFDIDEDGVKEIVVVGFRPFVDTTFAIDYGTHPNIVWLDWDDSTWDLVSPVNDIDTALISLETVDIDGDGFDELIAANHDVFATSNLSRVVSISATVSSC